MKLKTTVLSVLSGLLLTSLVYAGGQVVPGKSMGEVVIGVTPCDEIKKTDYNFNVVDYTCKNGVVDSIQTNTGGTIWIDDPANSTRIQVGYGTILTIVRKHGEDFRADFDHRYPQSVAYWITYKKQGIAFRIIYTDIYDINIMSERSNLQSIKVFSPID